MKHILQHVFEYIGKPENFVVSLALIMLYTVFVIIVGMCLSWVLYYLVSKKLNHDNHYPVSFDDLIDHTDRQSGRKVGRMDKTLKVKNLIILLAVLGLASCSDQTYCYQTKGIVISGSGYHQKPPALRFK